MPHVSLSSFGLLALMCDSSQSGLVNVSQQSLSASLAVPHQNLEDREGGRLTRTKLPPANFKYHLSRGSGCWPAEQSVTGAAERLVGSEEQSSCEVPRRALQACRTMSRLSS